MVQLSVFPWIAVLTVVFIRLTSGQNLDERAGSDQKSLMIVFDMTSSMASDLTQLRLGANDIVNDFASRNDTPIFNYILSLFDDPCKFNCAS